jgi:hypothetical protein
MSLNVPPPPPPAPPAPVPQTAKKTRWLLYGCGGLLALLLLVIGTVFVTIWWIQRPIKPVVLSAREKTVVDEKLRKLDSAKPSSPAFAPSIRTAPTTAPVPDRNAEVVELPGIVVPPTDPNQGNGPPYTPGSKVLKLTEREINGLLNLNTDLGQTVRLEFAQDAINAYIAVPIPKDFPIGGGRMFRARGSFRVSVGNGGAPYAILEDVTVFGLSLPKAWLGGVKGENLIGQAMGERNGKPVLKGIKRLHVEPGALVLELED